LFPAWLQSPFWAYSFYFHIQNLLRNSFFIHSYSVSITAYSVTLLLGLPRRLCLNCLIS
jgi:hypothetical protein